MPQSSFLKADGLAAQWTGSPLALASALNKLVAGTASPTYSGGPHTSHLFAVDPWLHESAPDGLKKRILELESLTGWQHRAA